MPQLHRRQMLKGLIALLAGSVVGYEESGTGVTSVLAQSLFGVDPIPPKPLESDNRRLIIIFADGGLDGMSLLIPSGDPDYKTLRGDLALLTAAGDPVGVRLNADFALHPVVAPVFYPMWQQKELIFFPNISSPYKGNEHMAARKILQNGTQNDDKIETGWLARSLDDGDVTKTRGLLPVQPTISDLDSERRSLGSSASKMQVNQNLKLYDHRVMEVFADDDVLRKAMDDMWVVEGMDRGFLSIDHDIGHATTLDSQSMVVMTESAARKLAQAVGPRLAIISVNGFDSHIQQGNLQGQLPQNMAALAEAIRRARLALLPVWEHSLILVISEFGRSIKPNAKMGTDHGHAGLAMLVGGDVQGGQIIGDWNGLYKDVKSNDNKLTPSIDSRSLFKSVIKELYNANDKVIENAFPNSGNILPLVGLFRSERY